MKMFLTIALIIVSIVLTVAVMLQPSKSEGISSIISGGNENYFAKNKVRTYETTLVRITQVSALLFALIIIGLNVIK
ncbi:preprotein translocase subunit SecG [Hathewaya limosa]|uniref:Protein-export membrane protein SecG n=1 Tax=Hathewaya limosa TaxID=1536 RepID=A0ABU0JWW9_HATLI|nr:preprotein translocase subunit SecG [Hathewaya limosa]AWZ47836.1 preprotein translocase subunit SecG [Clostridiaceae bacterium 14S0207]MDQ0480653.1 preprotein translocase subunit SecG [Hathewaya limosa]